jgi:hypothetical protein
VSEWLERDKRGKKGKYRDLGTSKNMQGVELEEGELI